MIHLRSLFHRCPVSKMADDGLPIVVSFPKAGRTWLRVMLDEMEVYAHYDHDRTSHKKKAHWNTLCPSKEAYAKRKVVFLARDPRDTVVSGFFQATLREGSFRGDISDFIRDPHHGLLKICHFYAQWEKAGPQLPRFLLVKYEDIHADGADTLVTLNRFITEAPLCCEKLEKALEAGKFDVMHEREKSGYYAKSYGGKLTLPERIKDQPEAAKIRRGKVGGYVDYLSEADIAYCAAVMEKTGYPFGYGTRA